MDNRKSNKVIVILGPTASGKTGLGVKLAQEFNGEIISADSRQVYKGMDIGTGKDLGDYGDIPFHLIDVAEPNEVFDVAQYKQLAEAAIADILSRGKLPIVVGGSGLYLQALVDNYQLSTVKPNNELREKLEAMSLEDLQNLLAKQSQSFFDKLNNSDRNNKRRLIRYIEITNPVIARSSDRNQGDAAISVPFDRVEIATPSASLQARNDKYNFLLLGLTWPKEVLAERIEKRLKDRLEKEDMIEEVASLHQQGVSWQRLESFGLEYKFIAQYLQEKIDYDTMFIRLNLAIGQFAKRQLTWFKRWERGGRKFFWETNYIHISKTVNDFLERNF